MSSRRLQSSASQPADEHAQSARQSLDILFEMSNLLNTGLDRQQLACAVALLEDGTSPEALAAVIRDLRAEAAKRGD